MKDANKDTSNSLETLNNPFKKTLWKLTWELNILQQEIQKIKDLNKWEHWPSAGSSEKKETYTNSNGQICKLYAQDDPRWKNVEIWRGNTIGKCGWNYVAIACLCSVYDPSINPKTVVENAKDMQPDKAIAKILGDTVNTERLKITDNNTKNEIKEHLKNWYETILLVEGRQRWGQNKLAGPQQYLALVDYRNNNGKEEVFIANSDNGSRSGWISMEEALVSVKEATLITPTR